MILQPRLDPARAFRPGFLLPQRSICLKIIHQDSNRLEGIATVNRKSRHQYDGLAGPYCSNPMDHQQIWTVQATGGFLYQALDFLLREPGIMIDTQLLYGGAVGCGATKAHKTHQCSAILAA